MPRPYEAFEFKDEEGRPVRPARKEEICNDLVMDDTPKNKINLVQMLKDEPELWEVLKLIMDPDEFMALFLPNTNRRFPKRLSRRMLHNLDRMVDNEFVLADPDVVIAAFTVFLYKKKTGKGRFIQNLKWLNQEQRKPAEMGLPKVKDFISRILEWRYANQADGVGFFYQFCLHHAISPYFGMRLAGARGKVVTALMRRMPMGWSHSPRIAQRVANFLMKDLGLAWVDNLVFGGRDVEEYLKKRAELARRLQRYNVQVDQEVEKLEPLTKLTCVGVEFDLESARYRVDPSWITKRAEDIDRARLKNWQGATYREVFTTIGALIWPTHVADRPLWMYPEALQALSTLSSQVKDWDSTATVPQSSYDSFAEWAEDVVANPWRNSPSAKEADKDGSARYVELAGDPSVGEPTKRVFFVKGRQVFTDSSDYRCAYAVVEEAFVTAARQWSRETFLDSILCGEAEALCTAAREVGRRSCFVVDNQALHFIARKGHSRNIEVNRKMRETFGDSWPSTTWCASEHMVADDWSRNVSIPALPVPVSTLMATRNDPDWGLGVENKAQEVSVRSAC